MTVVNSYLSGYTLTPQELGTLVIQDFLLFGGI